MTRRLQLFAHPDGRTVLHQSGFSWLAALSLPIWALQRGLRPLAAVALVAQLVPGPLLLMLGASDLMALGGAWLLMVGFGLAAARLHAAWMHRHGWIVLAQEPLPGATGPQGTTRAQP